MYLGLLHKIENVCKHAKETVFLVTLKIQTHTVPHMKGVVNVENISGRQECDITFTYTSDI